MTNDDERGKVFGLFARKLLQKIDGSPLSPFAPLSPLVQLVPLSQMNRYCRHCR